MHEEAALTASKKPGGKGKSHTPILGPRKSSTLRAWATGIVLLP